MREKFEIYYRPAIHHGKENKNNDLIIYKIELDEAFENRTENEKFSGIGGTCLESGNYKRCRLDRIEGMWPVEEGSVKL